MTDSPPAQNQVPRQPARSTPFGVYTRPEHNAISSIEIVAIALSAVWLLASAIFFLMQPPAAPADTSDGGLRFLMTMLVVFLPVGMIWVAATAARASRVMREESRRLQAAIDAIRHAYIAQQQGQSIDGDSSVSRKLDEIAAAARR